MSAPASRPVHPCVVSVTQQGSRGAEFSTWAYLTHSRGPAWQPQPSNTTTNNHNDSNDSPPAGESPLPNLVTAAGSSIHVYSHCPTTQQLKLEVSFPNIAGTICFLATLTPKRLHHDERDALLIGVAAPARLTVVTLERNEHGPLLQAVCLMDFSTIATAAAGTTTTTNTSTLEDAQYTLLDEGATGQYHHNYNNNTLTASQSISTAPSSSSSSKVKPKNYRNNRTTRPGLATVAVVLGGGSGVAVCELVCQPIQPQQHGHPIQHGWFALEPYILPLHALSRQLPHLRNSAASEQDTTNNNNAAMAGGNNPNNPNNPTANTTENNANQPMATGWGDMIHATFLSGYLEPVLLILHTAAGGRPWAGRWARENTSGPPPTFVTALSVGVAHRRAALLWSLPATVDAQTLQPLPNGTSCLVVGTNIIMSIQAGKIHQILAVNGWAHTTCPATLKPQLQPNAPMKLALQLDGCQICVLHSRACLVVLRRGQVYLLQKTMTSSNSSGPCWSLFPTGQSLASTMGEVAQLQSWPFQQQQQQQQQHDDVDDETHIRRQSSCLGSLGTGFVMIRLLNIALDSLVPALWAGLLVQTMVGSSSPGRIWPASLSAFGLTLALMMAWNWGNATIAGTIRNDSSISIHRNWSDCLVDIICPHWPCLSRRRASNNGDVLSDAAVTTVQSTVVRPQGRLTSSITSSMVVDEALWYDWTVGESMIWILQMLQQRTDNSDALDNANRAVALLSAETLTCLQLLKMESLADLRCLTGIPYGQLLYIRQCIQERLQAFYPIPNQQLPIQPQLYQQQQQQAGWLAQHDHEYNGGTTLRRRDKRAEPMSKPMHHDALASEDHHSTHQHASDIMKERFGLELPTRKSYNPESGNDAVDRHQPLHPTSSLPGISDPGSTLNNQTAQQGAGGGDNSVWGSLPPEFLANMPPHISEIVKRKPHLVEQILKQHRNTLAKRQKEPPLNIRPEENEVGAQSGSIFSSLLGSANDGSSDDRMERQSLLGSATAVAEGDENFDDEPSDGETTELLLRHRRRGTSSLPMDQPHHGSIAGGRKPPPPQST